MAGVAKAGNGKPLLAKAGGLAQTGAVFDNPRAKRERRAVHVEAVAREGDGRAGLVRLTSALPPAKAEVRPLAAGKHPRADRPAVGLFRARPFPA